jgi:hypothetical protein
MNFIKFNIKITHPSLLPDFHLHDLEFPKFKIKITRFYLPMNINNVNCAL